MSWSGGPFGPTVKEEDRPMAIETTMSAYRLADETIGLFLEYRDVHGYDEKAARAAAARDTQEGIDAEVELRARGEIA